jgi:hypothetical protein
MILGNLTRALQNNYAVVIVEDDDEWTAEYFSSEDEAAALGWEITRDHETWTFRVVRAEEDGDLRDQS